MLHIMMVLVQVVGVAEVQTLLRHNISSQFSELLGHNVCREIEGRTVAVLLIAASKTSIEVITAIVI